MYYPKLTYASFTIEGVFLLGILCLSNKIYGLESLYYIGNFQIMHMEETNKSQWETPLCPIHVVTFTLISILATDYIQKRRGQALLFSFEYNLSPNLISK